MRRKIINLKVVDVEKRRYPSKHYVYIIEVKWDDRSDTIIFRRYSKFFDLQIGILETFPKEGGLRDPSERIIPFLPGKILFGRSHVREVAMKRLKPIDEYCNEMSSGLPPSFRFVNAAMLPRRNVAEIGPTNSLHTFASIKKAPLLFLRSCEKEVKLACQLFLNLLYPKIEPQLPKALIRLPPHISNNELVLDFFESKPDDLNPSKEESKRSKKEQDINEISGPMILEQYTAIADYTKTQQKELTIAAGQHLEVIEKLENGWWFVSDEEGEKGWVPGVYLAKQDGKSENLVTKQAELGQGEKYITISQYTGEKDEISFGVGVLVEVLQKNLEGWWYVSYQGKQGWAPASYLEKPADAVLRQSNKSNLSVDKSTAENRRSYPGDIQHSVFPKVATEPATSSSPSVPRQRKHLQLIKTNSNPSNSSKDTVKNAIFKPKPNPVRPPPKRSSINRNSIVLKPQNPPPLPPSAKAASESVYEYFTSASFSADIPHSISFEKDKKVKVIEKSPGDWWYIALGDKEGWAPASHVKKIFTNQNTKSPPERPKLPTSLKKPVLPEKASKEKNSQMEKMNSDATTFKPTTTLKPAIKPSVPSVKPVSSNTTNSRSILDASAKFDFKSLSNKVKQNHGNTQADKVTPVSKKLPLKPTPFLSKPKLKPTQTPQNNFDEKKPVSTPARPINNLRKPVSTPARPINNLKKPAVPGKKPQTTLESKNGHVDFRSVLKSSSNTSRPVARNYNSNNKRPAVPEKPVVPSKPDRNNIKNAASLDKKPVTSRRTKFENNFQATQNGNGIPPKPVLRRFQKEISNQNKNNNTESNDVSTMQKGVLLNRVEVAVPHIASNSNRSAFGEKDNVACDDELLKSRSSNDKARQKLAQNQDTGSNLFVAVADYNPESPSEMDFFEGDVATLLDASDIHWWYVNINEKVGWVPCSYFKKHQSSSGLNGECANLVEDEPVYSEIYDSVRLTNDNKLKTDLYRVTSDYTGSDDSTVSVGKGDTVHIVDQSDEWSYVRIVASEIDYLNGEGWLPSHCLQKVQP